MSKSGHREQQRRQRHDGRSDRDLRQVARFLPASRERAPEHDGRQDAQRADHGVERQQPRDGHLVAQELQVEIGLPPDDERVEHLLVADHRPGHEREQADQQADGLPIAGGERGSFRPVGESLRHRQPRPAVQIQGQSDQHANAGGSESEVPAHLLAERPADERRDDYGAGDRELKRLERRGAAEVGAIVELTDLAGDVALEAANADEQQRDGQQERRLEGHQEMTHGHQQGTDRDGRGPIEPAIGEQAAQ